jgi:hypothetical protein
MDLDPASPGNFFADSVTSVPRFRSHGTSISRPIMRWSIAPVGCAGGGRDAVGAGARRPFGCARSCCSVRLPTVRCKARTSAGRRAGYGSRLSPYAVTADAAAPLAVGEVDRAADG